MSHRPKRVPDTMIAALNARMERERLSNVAAAKQIGVTEGAVRLWRKMRRAPKPGLSRKALAAWLGNGAAK